MSIEHTCEELLLNLDSVGNNTPDGVGMCTALEVTEEQTHEIGVHALITADELVREGKAGHQAPLQPEDGRE